MLIMQDCLECGETQTDDWDDEFAIPYLKSNEHMKLENGTVILPPDICDLCNENWYEIIAHADMNADDCY